MSTAEHVGTGGAALATRATSRSGADQRFMHLALALGRRGLGNTWPNPAVGAVVVKDGVILGRGWTQPGGRPHAETEALKRAGRARAAPRSTSRSSPARTTARRRRAPTPSSAPASPASSRRWTIPIRRWRGRASRGCASAASRSKPGLAPRRRAAPTSATSGA